MTIDEFRIKIDAIVIRGPKVHIGRRYNCS